MGTVNVAQHLSKERIVKRMDGSIIDWFDESDGGWIIRKGQVVNQDRIDRHNKRIIDEQEAALAVTTVKPVSDELIAQRNSTPVKRADGSVVPVVAPVAPIAQVAPVAPVIPPVQSDLEKRIDSQDAKLDLQDKKLDAILAVLSGNKNTTNKTKRKTSKSSKKK